MRIIELCSGNGSFSNKTKSLGYEAVTIDIDSQFKPDILMDVMDIKRLGDFDVLWVSIPCGTWSIASCHHHWRKINEQYIVQSDKARNMLKLLEHVIKLWKESNIKYIFIENPRGLMRKMDIIQQFNRYTVTYCQYGYDLMKPTDIFTNLDNMKFKPMCKNGAPCHISAPRGLSNENKYKWKDRIKIPDDLCYEILLQLKGMIK